MPFGVLVPSVVCTTAICSVVMNSLLRRFQRRQVVGQRRAEPVIGRRGRDRRGVQQRQGRGVELGDFEVVGAGGSPAEGRLLHLALQQVDVAVAGLRRIGLQGAVDRALDRGGRGRSARWCRR